MEREMKELKRQRDNAQSQPELERKANKELKLTQQLLFPLFLNNSNAHLYLRHLQPIVSCLSFPVEDEPCIGKRTPEIRQRNLEQLQRQLGEEANQALEVLHKEVAFHRLGSQATTETIMKMLSEIKDMQVVNSLPEEIAIGDKANLKDEITRLNSRESAIASLERKLDNVQKAIDMLVSSFPSNEENPENKFQLKKKNGFPSALSNSSNVQNIIRSPCIPLSSSRGVADIEIENRVPDNSNLSFGGGNALPRPSKATSLKSNKSGSCTSSREGTPNLPSNSVNVKKMQRMFKNAAEENVLSIRTYVTKLKERVAKLKCQKQLLVHQRTQFYLLFKGDPSDQIYMEVELRQLSWLEQHYIKALKQEREYLAKRVSSKLTAEEREMLYAKWEIPSVGKQTRLQPVNKLRTDPLNMQHMQESAEIIAKLVRFCESGERISKEMFELNFVSPCDKKKWMGWNLISNLLAF
ncbi:hypothetical protein P3X46_019664 [Hevea brasiliensis]|uniref:NPK1-activating kinesin-like protein C-terminal domain-containing protein n=1 Tax=Hevea brasiliensis TaxID=3981 RepID=A0ABQ9LJH2_HEVBR|nr:hypothetical protein P3X46_019664 [Hevea brasiliensis]